MSEHASARAPLGAGIAAAEQLSREVAILAGRLASLLGTDACRERRSGHGRNRVSALVEPPPSAHRCRSEWRRRARCASDRSSCRRVRAGTGGGRPLLARRDGGGARGVREPLPHAASAGRASAHRRSRGAAALRHVARASHDCASSCTTGAAARSGALVLGDDAPFFERSLHVADACGPHSLASTSGPPACVRSRRKPRPSVCPSGSHDDRCRTCRRCARSRDTGARSRRCRR